MTETPVPPRAPEWASLPPQVTTPKSVVPGLVSLCLALLALPMTLIAPIAGLVFVVALAAIVLGIIALARRAPMRGLPIAGIIVAVVAWGVSILTFVLFAMSGAY